MCLVDWAYQSLQKVNDVIQILAYVMPPNTTEDYIKIRESLATTECITWFFFTIVAAFFGGVS